MKKATGKVAPARYHRPKNKDYWLQKGVWHSSEGLRVAMLDLDGTLMNTELCREHAWDRSLKQLGDSLGQLNQETRVSAYKAVYKNHSHITGKKGPRGHEFEDFRQEWNTRSSYALLIAWFQTSAFPREGNNAEYEASLERILLDRQAGPELLAKAEAIRDPWSIDYAVPIERAVAVFWDGDWTKYLYPGVTKLLRSLAKAGILYCVATEGHVPTQWMKISKVGLNYRDDLLGRPLIEQEQLLATSQAAQPRSEIDAMNDLIRWYHGRAAASEEAAKRLEETGEGSRTLVSEAYNEAKAGELTAKGLERISGLFRRLAEKLHGRGGTKFPFYARTLYAINRDPERPRTQFLTFKLNWQDDTRIRVAMVGDSHKSDVGPVLELVERLRTFRPKNSKIMTVWLRDTGHGKDSPERDHGIEKQWLESGTIQDAGQDYLLNSDVWRNHTDCLERPHGMFGSAVHPEKGEFLQTNLHELIAGIGAVWGDRYDRRPSVAKPAAVLALSEFMDREWFDIIVADIHSDDFRDQIQTILLNLCFDPLFRSMALFQCEGGRFAALQLLLSVAAEEDGTIMIAGLLDRCAELLNISNVQLWNDEWAAVTIDALVAREAVQKQIARSELVDTYLGNLKALVRAKGELAHWFPVDNLFLLIAKLQEFAGPGTWPPPPPLQTLPPPPTIRIDQLGLADSERRNQQQSVFLGTSKAGREVWCHLGGPKARNIISICGDVGMGKFRTLAALAAGALQGSGLPGSNPARSSVIVFNIFPADAAERLAGFAQTIGVPAELVVLPDEVGPAERVFKGRNVTVRSLAYTSRQLNNDVVTEWVCGSKPRPEFSDSLKKFRNPENNEFDLEELIRDVSKKKFHSEVAGAAVVNALKALRPFLASTGTVDSLAPGKLTILDAGRISGATKDEVARHWNRFVSVLSDPSRAPADEDQYLFLFDELPQMFNDRQTHGQKNLAKTLNAVAGVGRSAHISMVGISQAPKELLRLAAFSGPATVLLFHKLTVLPPSFPSAPLWDLASRARRDFGELVQFEVWYGSTAREETDGRVVVPEVSPKSLATHV